jgi:glycosyltransferase involved in cell wall biosynthesis
VLRNGVDLQRFTPVDRDAARVALGVEGFVLLSVGSLIARKGHDLTIEALTRHPDCTLLIAGQGPMRGELEALAHRQGVADRVRFLGEIPHADLSTVYSAADVMVLASSREGWANVLLESMACGTPVLATDVNGAREIVRSPAAGLLVRNRNAAALAGVLEKQRAAMPTREATRRYAEGFGWDEIAEANRALLTAVAAAGFEHRRSVESVRAVRRHLAASLEGVA